MPGNPQSINYVLDYYAGRTILPHSGRLAINVSKTRVETRYELGASCGMILLANSHEGASDDHY